MLGNHKKTKKIENDIIEMGWETWTKVIQLPTRSMNWMRFYASNRKVRDIVPGEIASEKQLWLFFFERGRMLEKCCSVVWSDALCGDILG